MSAWGTVGGHDNMSGEFPVLKQEFYTRMYKPETEDASELEDFINEFVRASKEEFKKSHELYQSPFGPNPDVMVNSVSVCFSAFAGVTPKYYVTLTLSASCKMEPEDRANN